MRIAGKAHGRAYATISKLFVSQFFLFRWAAPLYLLLSQA